ncbi:MAG: PspC domain-containing protein [Dermatophilaceae bacterium]
MSEQSTSRPHTGMDKFFGALRGPGIRRRTHDKWVAGVCSGIADRLGVDPVIVRAALVLLALLGGAGITIYLVAWALLPNDRDEIVAQRAVRDGDGGSIVLLIFTAFALFGASTWGSDARWFLMVPFIVFVWWLVQQSRNHPNADQRVNAHQSGSPYPAGPTPTAPVPVAPRRLGRRSGGPLMALIAIGLALVTYGSLSWLGTELSWTGDHQAIAFAGSLAAMGLLMVVLGLAGWRPGFVTFLAILLSIAAWSSAVVPTGIHLGGRIGDATWAPTSVTPDANYHLGVGNGVLNLSGLPTEGLREAKIPVYVGMGDLKVVVPQGLTVKVVGHVGLGEILLPTDAGRNGQGGSDVSRSVVIGDGPTQVVVDAGVGIGQLTVVKE